MIALALLAGCGPTTLRIEPNPPDAPTSFRLVGKIVYPGNPTYLPTSLTDASESAVHIAYRTDATYRHSSAAQLFNPLLLFGFHGIGTDAEASAALTIGEDGQTSMDYHATCTAHLSQSIYSFGGPTDSEARRRGLLCAARLIDAELERDQAELRRRFSVPPSESSPLPGGFR